MLRKQFETAVVNCTLSCPDDSTWKLKLLRNMMAKVFPASSMVRRPQSKFGGIWSTVGCPFGNTWFWLKNPLEMALQAKSAKKTRLAGMPARCELLRIKSKWSWWPTCWDFVEKLNGLALRAHAILGLRWPEILTWFHTRWWLLRWVQLRYY